jgi:hypothetical protein
MAAAPKVQQPATAEVASPTVNSGVWTPQNGPESKPTDNLAERPSPKGGTAEASEPDQRRARVVQALMSGALEGTQERIAGTLGIPKTTMRRIVEADSRLRLSVGPAGSRLELVTA